jgi:uncharacterized membrane protein (UPF0127 family)
MSYPSSQQPSNGSPVVNDKPFSAGCVFWFAIIGFALTCLIAFGGRGLRSMLPAEWKELFQTVTLAGKPYRLEVARTDAVREQGLSYRASLPPGTGMRFIFPVADRYTFWMNKMNFSIDMIFLNNGAIVNIANNVPYPKTPTEEPVKVMPQQAFNEVLELPAGDADRLGLKIGQRLSLP